MVGIENLSMRLARAEKERRALEAEKRAAQQAAATDDDDSADAETAEQPSPAPAAPPAPRRLNLGTLIQRLPLPRLDRLLLILIVAFLAGMLLAHFF